MIKENKQPQLYIENQKYKDFQKNSYKRYIRKKEDDSLVAELVITKELSGEYRLKIQLPVTRKVLYCNKTPAALEKKAVEIVQEKENDLLQLNEVSKIYVGYLECIKNMRKWSPCEKVEIDAKVLNFGKKLKELNVTENSFCDYDSIMYHFKMEAYCDYRDLL